MQSLDQVRRPDGCYDNKYSQVEKTLANKCHVEAYHETLDNILDLMSVWWVEMYSGFSQ